MGTARVKPAGIPGQGGRNGLLVYTNENKQETLRKIDQGDLEIPQCGLSRIAMVKEHFYFLSPSTPA